MVHVKKKKKVFWKLVWIHFRQWHLCWPFEHNRYRDSRVGLESVYDVWRFVTIYPLDSFTMDDLWRASDGVVQPEFGLFLGRHAGDSLLNSLQNTDSGEVRLQHHIKLHDTRHMWSNTELDNLIRLISVTVKICFDGLPRSARLHIYIYVLHTGSFWNWQRWSPQTRMERTPTYHLKPENNGHNIRLSVQNYSCLNNSQLLYCFFFLDVNISMF